MTTTELLTGSDEHQAAAHGLERHGQAARLHPAGLLFPAADSTGPADTLWPDASTLCELPPAEDRGWAASSSREQPRHLQSSGAGFPLCPASPLYPKGPLDATTVPSSLASAPHSPPAKRPKRTAGGLLVTGGFLSRRYSFGADTEFWLCPAMDPLRRAPRRAQRKRVTYAGLSLRARNARRSSAARTLFY